MGLCYQVYSSYVIASDWDDNFLKRIVVCSDNQLWECAVGSLESPLGMEQLTFTNLLKQLFLFDTSGMVIHQAQGNLIIDCKHEADGVIFTFTSFILSPSDNNLKLFYQDAIMNLVTQNVSKTVNTILTV